MGPKKKEKEAENTSNKISNNFRIDPVQADHELFLQAFEKPTQIYRYLRTRHSLSPVFMHRTLSYMKGRCSRNNKKRKDFKVDSVLESVVQKNQELDLDSRTKYMTLTFLGFYDSKVEKCQDPVRVETLLLKIGHKKRKDVSSPIMQISVGTTEVCINPSEDLPPPKAPTVSIATQDLSLRNGHQGNSYVLLLRVSAPVGGESEPAPKRRRLSEIHLSSSNQQEVVRLYGSELIVYDRHSRCLLVDGDYELALQELNPSEMNTTSAGLTGVDKSPRKATASWTTLESPPAAPLTVLAQGPTLKFRLEWAEHPVSGLVDRPRPYVPVPQGKEKQSISTDKEGASDLRKEEKMCVRYQFLYHSNRRQQTEARHDLHCPWCSLHCLQLPSLLKHLRLCHSRFVFSHVMTGNDHVRIDVSVNESYDGTYTGNPHDLIAQPSLLEASACSGAFGRQGPTRRTPVTAILIWRPRRLRSATCDMETEEGYEVCETQRPFITGHNRLYHHTSTCLPIQPKELEVDSEGETDPEWLRIKTCMMIDEFTDVNEGEKELMKMWNLHVLKHNYVGDCQMPLALQMFLEAHGEELLGRNLYRNFVLHLSNLYDFGIIGPATVLRTVASLQRILQRNPEIRGTLSKIWLDQLPPVP